jgi:hypothetical protein
LAKEPPLIELMSGRTQPESLTRWQADVLIALSVMASAAMVGHTIAGENQPP